MTALPRRLPATAGPRSPALAMPPAPAWTALAHHAAWSLCRDSAGRWYMLPALIQIVHMAGVNGVTLSRDDDGRPVADARGAVAEYVSRGYIEVPPVAVHAHGRTMPDYCVGHRAARGMVHTWAWVQPVVAQGRAVRQVDRDAECEFRRWVMTDLLGADGAPEDILAAHRVKMRDRAARLCVEVRSRPAAARQLEILAEQLRSMGWDEGLPFPAEYRGQTPSDAPVAPLRAAGVPVASLLDDPEVRILLMAHLRAELGLPTPLPVPIETPTPAPPAGAAQPVSSGAAGEAGALGLPRNTFLPDGTIMQMTLPDNDIPPDNARPRRPKT